MTPHTPAEDAAARLADLGERYFAIQHAYEPYNATLLGIPDVEELAGDPSRDADRRASAELGAVVAEVDALPPDGLDEAARVDAAVLRSLAHGAQQDAEHALWAANASPKGYISRQGLVFQAVPETSLSDAAGVERFLSRLAGLPAYFRALGERYSEEAGRGRVSTALGIRGSLAQLEARLDARPGEDVLLAPLRASEALSDDDRECAERLLVDGIRPELRRLAARLRDELLPGARDDASVGIAAVPGGEEGYAAAVARHTTTDLTPRRIHEIGLEELEILEREWAAIGERALGETRLPRIAERLRNDPGLRCSSSEEILGIARAALERAEGARRSTFPEYAIGPCRVEAIDPTTTGSAAFGYYQPPSLDGRRPGIYRLLATEPGERYRYEYEALTFHESVPGHHLQLAMAQQLDIPRYRRHLDVEACAFNEGWGLYAEQLADELGLYGDDLSRLGMLSLRALRASRLVVDTGIHAEGWSRDRAVAFVLEHTATTEDNARSEVDRYIAWPGQALAYLIGRREILRLREESRGQLGARFDLAGFHGAVLGAGPLPLTVLAETVSRWRGRTAEGSAHAAGDDGARGEVTA